MGAFGMDYYWAQVNTDIRPLRYSDFNIGETIRHDEPAELFRNDVIGTAKETLCKYVAKDCDAIVAGLYEYWATYNAVPELKDKMTFIPFPIKPKEKKTDEAFKIPSKVSLFILNSLIILACRICSFISRIFCIITIFKFCL